MGIFPGMSMGAVCCQATTIPERLFMVAAEAVANSLNKDDLMVDSIVPNRNNLRDVGLNVAAVVAFEAQNMGITGKILGKTLEQVKAAVKEMMWKPNEMVSEPSPMKALEDTW